MRVGELYARTKLMIPSLGSVIANIGANASGHVFAILFCVYQSHPVRRSWLKVDESCLYALLCTVVVWACSAYTYVPVCVCVCVCVCIVSVSVYVHVKMCIAYICVCFRCVWHCLWWACCSFFFHLVAFACTIC
jgi:hypothetical protein